ncbi:MAG: hypothetical protein KDA61_12295 [Planctomycetales bacterium]|nr:hypothetical protein [Planctomycetales bacterium]
MDIKKLASMALLAFVVLSVVVLARRAAMQTDAPLSSSQDVVVEPDGLVVYYFHGETRCPTCRNIEAFAHETVQREFSDELARGAVRWRTVDYEAAENGRYATKYALVAPTVVLVKFVDGHETQWRNLERVWELVGERPDFEAYVVSETRSMLGS